LLSVVVAICSSDFGRNLGGGTIAGGWNCINSSLKLHGRLWNHLLTIVVLNLKGNRHSLLTGTNEANNMRRIDLQLSGVVDAQVILRIRRCGWVLAGGFGTNHLS